MPALAAAVVAADPPLSSPLLAKIKMPAMIAITATIAMTGPQRRQGLLVLDGASPLLGCMHVDLSRVSHVPEPTAPERSMASVVVPR